LFAPLLAVVGITLSIGLVCLTVAAVKITELVATHRERLALIERGIDPDRRLTDGSAGPAEAA